MNTPYRLNSRKHFLALSYNYSYKQETTKAFLNRLKRKYDEKSYFQNTKTLKNSITFWSIDSTFSDLKSEHIYSTSSSSSFILGIPTGLSNLFLILLPLVFPILHQIWMIKKCKQTNSTSHIQKHMAWRLLGDMLECRKNIFNK